MTKWKDYKRGYRHEKLLATMDAMQQAFSFMKGFHCMLHVPLTTLNEKVCFMRTLDGSGCASRSGSSRISTCEAEAVGRYVAPSTIEFVLIFLNFRAVMVS